MSLYLQLDKDPLSKSTNSKTFHSMIDSILYLIASRVDIIFSVYLCVQFQDNPKESYLKVIKKF